MVFKRQARQAGDTLPGYEIVADLAGGRAGEVHRAGLRAVMADLETVPAYTVANQTRGRRQ